MSEMLSTILLIAVAVLFAANAGVLILTWRRSKTIDKVREADVNAKSNAPCCKECLYSKPYGELLPNTLFCDVYECLKNPDDFCSDGIKEVADEQIH